MKKVLVLDLDETLVHYNNRYESIEVRPYVKVFLKTVSECFDEIVIFTAAAKDYADIAIGLLERISGIEISRRYYRDSCMLTQSGVVKDLRMLGEPATSRVLLLDNTPSSYSLQPQCGVAIRDFRGDPFDDELINAAERLCQRVALINKVVARQRSYSHDLKRIAFGDRNCNG